MDVLSAVLRDMRFEAAGYRTLHLRAPWSVAFDQAGLRGIHIILKGRCELVWPDDTLQVLEAGDLVVAARADPHVLRSPGVPRARPIPASELARQATGDTMRVRGIGERAVILCGAFVFHESEHPALEALPRLIHVPGHDGRIASWGRGYVQTLLSEARDVGPGSEVLLARLTSALVVRALRFHAQQAPHRGWLIGLQDRHIARTLAAMHDGLERRWTVEALARIAGLSRAAFSARFVDVVEETPMRYLLRCRMHRVMRLLTESDVTLAGIAERVGYGSEAAASTAFKRFAGVPPRAYKRARSSSTVPGRR